MKTVESPGYIRVSCVIYNLSFNISFSSKFYCGEQEIYPLNGNFKCWNYITVDYRYFFSFLKLKYYHIYLVFTEKGEIIIIVCVCGADIEPMA
jgi:hypothetical protein